MAVTMGVSHRKLGLVSHSVVRANSWQAKLAHKKRVWCTERSGRMLDVWMAFSEVVIIVRRLIREA